LRFQSWLWPNYSASRARVIALNLLQFVIGSYIEPRVAGTAVSVSPFMVLFAVFFWCMLWGIAGAFIRVPIQIALATVCAGHPSVRPIAVLLSADTAAQTKKPTSLRRSASVAPRGSAVGSGNIAELPSTQPRPQDA
jgi:hypothetical protein